MTGQPGRTAAFVGSFNVSISPSTPWTRWIAAHALSLGLILVTNNTRAFARVVNLKIENWATG